MRIEEIIFTTEVLTFLFTIVSLLIIVWKVFTYMSSRDSCMRVMKEQIEETKENVNDLRGQLQKELSISSSTHKEITQRINVIDQNLHIIIGKIDSLYGK